MWKKKCKMPDRQREISEKLTGLYASHQSYGYHVGKQKKRGTVWWTPSSDCTALSSSPYSSAWDPTPSVLHCTAGESPSLLCMGPPPPFHAAWDVTFIGRTAPSRLLSVLAACVRLCHLSDSDLSNSHKARTTHLRISCAGFFASVSFSAVVSTPGCCSIFKLRAHAYVTICVAIVANSSHLFAFATAIDELMLHKEFWCFSCSAVAKVLASSIEFVQTPNWSHFCFANFCSRSRLWFITPISRVDLNMICWKC